MGFWSDASKLNTKRSYRWVCQFNNLDEWIIKSVTKPSMTISETAHRFFNHTFYYPGRLEWSAISLTLVDPVTPDASMTVLHMIEACGYQVPDEAKTKYVSISKEKSVKTLKNLVIKQLDPEGNDLETWNFRNPWIKDVKFSDLSYDGDDILNISMTIRYDFAECITANNSAAGAAQNTVVGQVPEGAPFPSGINGQPLILKNKNTRITTTKLT